MIGIDTQVSVPHKHVAKTLKRCTLPTENRQKSFLESGGNKGIERMNKVLHSSASIMWETPLAFFDAQNKIHNFNTDVCAIAENAKCSHYFTPETDGLKQDWKGVCWMNPPYSRGVTGLWVEKAASEARKGSKIVALLPARTDTVWFHRFIYNQPGVSIEFLKGRLKFGDSKNSAPFPSMIIIFNQ